MKPTKIVISTIISLSLLFSSIPTVSAQALDEDASKNYIQNIVNKTNTERSAQKISTLKTNSELMKAAQLKAEDMAKYGYFAHTSPTGVNPWYWFYEAGYKPSLAGENLALSRSLESDIMKNWMNSEGHKKNIVNKNYTEIGIGVAKGKYAGRDAYFIVQLFGKPGATK